mgnify:CR=1 FL=1
MGWNRAIVTPTLAPPQSIWDCTRASLEALLTTHRQQHLHLQPQLQPHWDQLEALNSKLHQRLLQIATLGLVSRGKSAVLNALYGEKVFPTGPLHGVTQWPRSIRWHWPESCWQIELIDTPGLDEIAGEVRAEMALTIARQADLILFVTSGELTPIEVNTLLTLADIPKPLLLIFNKSDLYPDQTAARLHNCLDPRLQNFITVNEILLTVAAPPPVQVRIEGPDGRRSYGWQTPTPQIDSLSQKLATLLQREGELLLVIPLLWQAQTAERAIASQLLQSQTTAAQTLIARFSCWKGIAIALNPIVGLDLLGGILADLLLVRGLSRLYGLSLTAQSASALGKTLLSSAGGLLLSEWGSGWLGQESSSILSHLFALIAMAILQGGIAAYGAYSVGLAGQRHLEQGCTWGPLGVSTILQNLLQVLSPDMLLYRWRQIWQAQLQDRSIVAISPSPAPPPVNPEILRGSTEA